ncbi:MAG: methyltransferase domain-containing protein [Pseudonocardiales bacterium]
MKPTVAEATWRTLVRQLADDLATQEVLRSPSWREALLAVPRHEFVPSYYLKDPGARPLRWIRHEPHDADSTQRWLELVYSPTTLITELADKIDRGIQAPVSSSTSPRLMIRMLEALEVSTETRVLEIGTGTGYNAALLSHRLGGRNVCSIDIDPDLVSAARERLARLGYRPTLVTGDGAAGLAERAPFDRILATCALYAIPASWIDQLRPGGLALAHIEGPLGAGNLLALRRGASPVLQGRFLPWWGCFMRRRATASPTVGTPLPTRTRGLAVTRRTAVDPAELEQSFQFLAQLYLPPGMFRSISLDDNGVAVSHLRAPDGSWCEVNRQPDADGYHAMREAGPTPLWAGIETAWQLWQELGTPPWHEFGLTATPTEHRIWLRDPQDGLQWTLPTPDGSEEIRP